MKGKALIVYYSQSGNTRRLAELIHESTGADLCEIEALEPYAAEGQAVIKRAKTEFKEGIHPAYKPVTVSISDYDTIFIGSPNWCGTIAFPLITFLEEQNWSGKTVAAFLTHGGGGMSNMEQDIRKFCGGADFKPSYCTKNDGGEQAKAEIEEWLKNMNE